MALFPTIYPTTPFPLPYQPNPILSLPTSTQSPTLYPTNTKPAAVPTSTTSRHPLLLSAVAEAACLDPDEDAVGGVSRGLGAAREVRSSLWIETVCRVHYCYWT